MATINDDGAHVKREERINHASLYAGALVTWHATYGDQVGLAREMFAHGSAALEFRADGNLETQIVQRGAFWLALGARAMQDAWTQQLRQTADALGAAQCQSTDKRKCPSCLAMEVFAGDVCEFCAELPAVLGDGDGRPLWEIVADPCTYEGIYGRMLVRGR